MELLCKWGGWANFEYWITRHAQSYFKECEKIENENNSLKKKIEFLERKIRKLQK